MGIIDPDLPCRLLLHATSQFHTIDPINPRKRRKFSDVVVCYVDQSALLGGAEKSADIERIARTSGFTYVRVPLENAFTMADGSDAAFLAADVLDSTGSVFRSSLSPNLACNKNC